MSIPWKSRRPAADWKTIEIYNLMLYTANNECCAKKHRSAGAAGSTLDAGDGPARWERWRPTVSVCQHEDLLVDRFEILHQRRFQKLAERVREDITSVSPETEVRLHRSEWRDPWDFEEVYATLHEFARQYPFQPDHEDYLVHITTGIHVAQICLFLLTESRHLPASLLQTSPPPAARQPSPGPTRSSISTSRGTIASRAASRTNNARASRFSSPASKRATNDSTPSSNRSNRWDRAPSNRSS